MRNPVSLRPAAWPALFGVLVVAFLLVGRSCESPVRAQVVIPDPCDEAVLRATCPFEDWHICYFLNGCWLPDQPTLNDVRFR